MTAREMFEKLGFTYSENQRMDWIEYARGDDKIYFNLGYQSYSAECFYEPMDVEMDELKAIYKQCEELGWLE